MTDEHKAANSGIVKEAGSFEGEPAERAMREVAKDIEEHGEIHATFQGVDGEVEMRLGTTLVDYDRMAFGVWDGDQYRWFRFDHLVETEQPMAVIHVE